MLVTSLTSTANMSTGVTTKPPDNESLDFWATSNNLGVLYDPKEIASFSSHRALMGTYSDRVTPSLLSRLEQKQERWEEAVNSIDFSHSSRKVWRTIN